MDPATVPFPDVPGVHVRHLHVDAFGLEMHVATTGPDEGPEVLLLHGFPELWYSWRHQMRTLADAGYRVIVPDLRGYGRTAAPPRPDQYTLLHIAGDLVGLMRASECGPCVVVGQDWGSPAATALALTRPDLVRGLVLVSTPYSPRGDVDFLTDLTERLGPDNYQTFFQEPGVAESVLEADVRATVIGSLLAVSGDAAEVHTTADIDPNSEIPGLPADKLPDWLSEDAVSYYTAEFTRTGYRGALNWYRNHRRNWELMAAWHEAPIHAPSMFVGGDRDPVLNWPGFREHAASLGDLLMPGMRRNVVLDGCGHWIPQERPEQLDELLLGFLEELG